MDSCRNCGLTHLVDLGFGGQVAPFFLKRVFNLELRLDSAANPIKKWLRRANIFPHGFFKKLYRTGAFIELQVCLDCHFVQTKAPFSEDALARLYFDYRSETYNAERIRYEPDYKQIADDVGRSAQETETRVATLTNWLRERIDFDDNFSMLDYGGADGRFLPKLAAKKYVYEISDTDPLEGIARIGTEGQLSNYSYVQLAHVLEHVPNPLIMVRKLLPTINPQGYMYIEVPQDLSDQIIARLIDGISQVCVSIHEHINFYTVRSVTELIRAAGLKVVDVQAQTLDLGWNKPTIIRGLGRKPENRW